MQVVHGCGSFSLTLCCYQFTPQKHFTHQRLLPKSVFMFGGLAACAPDAVGSLAGRVVAEAAFRGWLACDHARQKHFKFQRVAVEAGCHGLFVGGRAPQGHVKHEPLLA